MGESFPKNGELDPNAIYVFDFDGVLSSSVEDDIYHLSETEDEKVIIEKAANHFQIRCRGMKQKYQRHLVYQAAKWHLDEGIEQGPLSSFARNAAKTCPTFILTARAGWYPIARARKFLEDYEIHPVETFHVGRVVKDRQIDLLLREFEDRTLFYYDDSHTHLESLNLLSKGTFAHRFNPVHVRRSATKLDHDELTRIFVDAVQRSLKSIAGLNRVGGRSDEHV